MSSSTHCDCYERAVVFITVSLMSDTQFLALLTVLLNSAVGIWQLAGHVWYECHDSYERAVVFITVSLMSAVGIWQLAGHVWYECHDSYERAVVFINVSLMSAVGIWHTTALS